MSIRHSLLHFGQKRGKFLSTVSSRILSRVLFPQTGQRMNSVFSILFTPNCDHSFLIPIFPYEFITDRNANTKQKHNCQNCEIHTITSHFFVLHNPNGQEDRNRIHHDNSKTAKKTRSIGKDSTTEIIEFPIAGILERRSKVTKNRPLEYT